MSTTRADFESRLQRISFRGILASLGVELEVARWSARSATLELRLHTTNTEQWDERPLYNIHRRETAASTWPPAADDRDMDALDYVEEP